MRRAEREREIEKRLNNALEWQECANILLLCVVAALESSSYSCLSLGRVLNRWWARRRRAWDDHNSLLSRARIWMMTQDRHTAGFEYIAVRSSKHRYANNFRDIRSLEKIERRLFSSISSACDSLKTEIVCTFHSGTSYNDYDSRFVSLDTTTCANFKDSLLILKNIQQIPRSDSSSHSITSERSDILYLSEREEISWVKITTRDNKFNQIEMISCWEQWRRRDHLRGGWIVSRLETECWPSSRVGEKWNLHKLFFFCLLEREKGNKLEWLYWKLFCATIDDKKK